MLPAAQSFKFATFPIVNQVFYTSKLSLALVNLKPLVPGHVLVIPKRVVPRFKDLTAEEVTDLFLSSQEVGKAIEAHYKAAALNIAIQDGERAGQSVRHVHVHIIPRTVSDFEPMDKVYDALEDADLSADMREARDIESSRRRETRAERKAREREVFGVDNDARKPRSRGEMKEEAMRLAQLFDEHRRAAFVESDAE